MNTKSVHNSVANISKSVHPKCVICSSVNLSGLGLQFEANGDGSVNATFQCDESCEGYPGILHGGVILSLLDGAMGNCMFLHGRATVTVEMTTRFRHPVVTGQEAIVSARITRISYPLYLLEAEIIQGGKVKATAKGKYYDQPKLAHIVEQFS
ncbi:MAG: PaaI family thioesterase [Deltaproteobacteria bacterium]|nr:PaaI family thioesterase [Deltaproteobacteria bacterium]